MASITTHVLDTSIGRPAPGVAVLLEAQRGPDWIEVAQGVTDADGRVRTLGDVETGTYRIRFDVGAYFRARGTPAFFPWVEIAFTVSEAAHHHVPLLMSPFGYSTYRGS